MAGLTLIRKFGDRRLGRVVRRADWSPRDCDFVQKFDLTAIAIEIASSHGPVQSRLRNNKGTTGFWHSVYYKKPNPVEIPRFEEQPYAKN